MAKTGKVDEASGAIEAQLTYMEVRYVVVEGNMQEISSVVQQWGTSMQELKENGVTVQKLQALLAEFGFSKNTERNSLRTEAGNIGIRNTTRIPNSLVNLPRTSSGTTLIVKEHFCLLSCQRYRNSKIISL
ncbi:hypothetical protein O6P43_023689 [Quillaja saponaria]|uniref:Uncharacterized protein n=1 Tax=Quillaja saponaria TaxID=32244 RepID=A0AAD7LFU4_QUISA|nr:hypothetical protein O6P43_023689 [Quillaja saponaria]